jgi:hypothetical protein
MPRADKALEDQRRSFLAKNHAGGEAADGDYLRILLTGRGPNQPAAIIWDGVYRMKIKA